MQHFTIPHSASAIQIPVALHEVVHVEAQGNYVLLTTPGRSLMLRMSFATCIGMLPSGTGRQIHRSHWVASRIITGTSARNRRLFLTTTTGKQIPVARNRKHTITEWVRQLTAS
ncbi:LytTr DNA-binding domain-containing protein [Gemmobacter caeni]|jgi:DNA-binding LytR/AlgR family response regulator|uniref:LytTr DNA-binding domain-containing protein n=1 Tax=Gemmobacter caeni TaxID=589035 RepID=A0A2T6A7I8_9RHOB|nr:LytTR family DNA-binding domain-containing protein [Gemmobacter caeni]PTX39756.1 LytTr DNA-binding domain-containing protein [Gemmobacter caeni]TWI89839.1 LytTr DNA-binding domain-containing protein [Gemmobacter caeni]